MAHTEVPSHDPLLQPLTIKKTTFRNRVISTSHACGLQKDGFPQEAYQTYHVEKARGGLAMSMFGGSSNVDVDSPDVFSQLNVGTDAITPHLQRFSERMHQEGAVLMCQITHMGRRGDPYLQHWLPMIAPSPIRETLHRAIPREMDEYDVARVVSAYGAAARRCKEGGLDGIETLASAHLPGQFMSPKTNRRTDRFGGSLENRMRFPIMVHAAIKEAVGDDFLVGIRLTIDEVMEDGLGIEECLKAAEILKNKGLVDFFNALFGTMDTVRGLSEDNIPGMGTPIAPWVRAVGAFRREIGLPVFHAARISDLASARYAITDGHVDLVGMTRAHMADPHIVNKLASGKEDFVRPCVGAQHCQSNYRPKCLHNAATGRETTLSHSIPKASETRKAVVVGAGPAGLEAARVLAERGHNVSVYEAAAEAGGQVILASAEAWRKDLIGIIEWRCAELERLKVPIHYNQFVDCAQIMACNPNIVILATGGLPQVDFGAGRDLVLSTWDLIGRQERAAGDVLIYDGTGRHPAPIAAKLAIQDGANVRFVSLDNAIAQELTYAEAMRWRKEFLAMDIQPHYEMHLERVERSKNRLKATFVNDLTNQSVSLVAHQIFVEMGSIPMNDLFDELRNYAGNKGVTDLHALVAGESQPLDGEGFELHRIGDALASRNIHAAIYDALRLCSFC
ncbi:MAG: NADH:flavin oxidoreductase [Arenicellales bacterium]|jgi:2,4-dienoyl-CoA reductase-like NADH-dependent reductase (Old Yellow Enzyme family)|nr:NADH:flavin oxidoreductase [Arenicellales bacterium]MDP6768433.1 NADH:flavin oxidoreductase [Arenicellales bacterium]|tara:strand:- start:585 stop:2618 length:2034 start_codon:yes stop_codon:yes gene_type:complete